MTFTSQLTVFFHDSLRKDDQQELTWSAGKATHTMGYAYMSAAATHLQATGAPFFKVIVGSVTLLVSIAKRDDWEVITTKSDRVASDSAMPLVSGWGPKTTQQALDSLCADSKLVCSKKCHHYVRKEWDR